MPSNPKYYIIEASALPDVFLKVAEAKRLLDTGEVATVNEATRMTGISRSAFYKYRDAVQPFQRAHVSRIITFQFVLRTAAKEKEKIKTGPQALELMKQIITELLSADALRVLAVGYKVIDELPSEITTETLENGLTFMGILGMIDPPRPEAKAAVATCLRAGIRPVMITGDHIITASAIARELGILRPGQRAITGTELDEMTEAQLDACVEDISVYARVSPENKIRIVKAWQKKGHVVSMTGDGVNDAPALKAADIGCAMGITGTDVAKGASDMTLSDDNFATIVDAVKEGRGIYTNIKKVVGFLLGTNFGEVVAVFTAMLIWHKSPFMSMQLLWINLITDGLPAIALGMEPTEKDIMETVEGAVITAADGIRGGVMTASPKEKGSSSPCEYCEFKPICRKQ